MDLIGEEEGRLARLSAWLEASRAEMLGLALLLMGAVVASAALWWTVAGTGPEPVEVGGLETPSPAVVDGQPPAGGDDDEAARADDLPDESNGELTVHVTGAVGEPGLVTLPSGARVAEAVAAAGAKDEDAQLDRLNLARPLRDGEQVHVPREGEEIPPEVAASSDGAGGDGPIDINHADASALEQLPGVGPSRAAAIIEHRETHGPFGEPGDLREVTGIGEATFQQLAEQITVS